MMQIHNTINLSRCMFADLKITLDDLLCLTLIFPAHFGLSLQSNWIWQHQVCILCNALIATSSGA